MVTTLSLINLPKGTPFLSLFEKPSADFLSPSIYKISDGIYLNLSPFRPDSLEKDPAGPFITGVTWAASDGAARRALLMNIESDDGSIGSAPDDILDGVDASGYEAVLFSLQSKKSRTCQEKAAYRIASDGKFIHRMIETESFAFFFRSPENLGLEPPYAMIKKLN